MDTQEKIIIYQVFTRLFGNNSLRCKPNGSLEENGCGKMADFTTKALNEIRTLGATHIWYTGIIEHATQTNYTRYGIKPDHPAVVKGKAGSPYAIKDYYDVDPDLATSIPDRMKEFENLVTRSHKAGLKVIIDFVPNHVARQYGSDAKPKGVTDLGEKDDVTKAFSPNNNFYYIPDTKLEGNIDLHRGAAEPYIEFPAKATGNDRFDAWPNSNDWYETVKLNYGIDYLNGHSRHFEPIPDTWVKMRDILLFWSAKGIDGFRCDMAEMVPVEFWGWVIPQIKAEHPKLIFIAEVYNPGEYRNYLFNGKFDYLYDKVGLYDTLRAITCGWESATAIPQRWQSLGGIEKRMLNFLENHDEQRIASDYFAGNGSKAIPAMIVSACMNTNPVMIYFGQELGEHGMDTEGFSGRDGRTTIFDYWSVDSIRRWRNGGKFDNKFLNEDEKQLKQFYTRLLNICNSEKAIREGVFFDLTYANLAGWVFNEHKQYAFLRKQDDELIFIAEIYNPGEYRNYLFNGKFDYLYDKVGLYDTLRAITCGWESATAIPQRWQSLGGIEKRMLNFLENHDEQRIASDYFAGNGSKAIPAMIVSACMNTNPVMIYFGQELGEHGMDTEGFSGRDGRTTIFDYWSVDSIRRWRNGGKFDNKFLNEDEKQLKQFYTRLLNICNSEKAIREGVFFDLTYANLAGWVFNEHKQYAFLRKQDDELILIMVNFDSIPARSAVNIPQHAFDYLGIHRYGEYEATELLTGNTEKLTLMPDKTTPVLLDGMNGKILKFKL